MQQQEHRSRRWSPWCSKYMRTLESCCCGPLLELARGEHAAVRRMCGYEANMQEYSCSHEVVEVRTVSGQARHSPASCLRITIVVAKVLAP